MHNSSKCHIKRKPLGTLRSQKSFTPRSKARVGTTREVVFFKEEYDAEGHSAAMERPKAMLGLLKDFWGVLRENGAF